MVNDGHFRPPYNPYIEQAPSFVQDQISTAQDNDHPYCIPCIDFTGFLKDLGNFDASSSLITVDNSNIATQFCGKDHNKVCSTTLMKHSENLKRLIEYLRNPNVVCVTVNLCAEMSAARRNKRFLQVSPIVWEVHEAIVTEWLKQKITSQWHLHPKIYDQDELRKMYYEAHCNWKAVHEIRMHILKRLYSKALKQSHNFFNQFGDYNWIKAKEIALQCVGALPLPNGQFDTNCSMENIGTHHKQGIMVLFLDAKNVF